LTANIDVDVVSIWIVSGRPVFLLPPFLIFTTLGLLVVPTGTLVPNASDEGLKVMFCVGVAVGVVVRVGVPVGVAVLVAVAVGVTPEVPVAVAVDVAVAVGVAVLDEVDVAVAVAV
jgi:hypothetical protein